MSFNPEQEIIIIATVIAVGLLVLVVRWLYFNSKIYAVNRNRDEYMRILEALSNGQQDFMHYDRLAEVEARLSRLLRQSNSAPTGFILRHEPEMFGAFGPSPSVVRTYLQSFHESIGYFRARKNETVNPIFWIESLLNWPKSVLGMLGFNEHGAFANMLKLLVLVLEVVVGFLLVVSRLQQMAQA
ncbi:MAG: hypothetical protein OXI77_03960 [Chloroflexota bacterium]|nr:hypothetical protein [Chloroflexota bacterium]MDE2910928.1 hypothetical protein [Chloroflexota bacterium]